MTGGTKQHSECRGWAIAASDVYTAGYRSPLYFEAVSTLAFTFSVVNCADLVWLVVECLLVDERV
jgi:hypothetical protein